MPWGSFVIEWVHILLGIFWFGSALYANFILAPTMMRLDQGTRRELFGALFGRASVVMTWVGYLTVAAGFIRGTVFGRIQSVDILLGSRYGIVWLIALAVGLFLALWSHLVLARSAQLLIAMPQPVASGPVVPPRPDPMPRVVEMVGFFVLFTLMIVLKFS